MVMMDIVIAAALLLAVVIGAWRGLLQSLAGLIIVLLSFVGASWAARLLEEPVAQWLQPLLSEKIRESLLPTTDASAMLADFGFNGKPLLDLLEKVTAQVQETGQAVLTAVTDGIVHSIAYAVVYVAAFLVLLIVLWLLSKPLELATKLPGLHALNAIGGGALGLIWGMLLVFVATWAMQRFQWFITPQMIEQSLLLKFFVNNSPVSLIASL